jgi:hypothetical protein
LHGGTKEEGMEEEITPAMIDAALANLPSPYDQDMEDREVIRAMIAAILRARSTAAARKACPGSEPSC